MLKALLIAATVAFAGSVNAQTCASYNDTVISPVTFATAADAAPLQNDALRQDEFETAAQFRARIDAGRRAAAGTRYIISVPLHLSEVRYNADAGAFIVRSSAINSVELHWQSAFAGTALEGNGYGNFANTSISLTLSDLEAVFERNSGLRESIFAKGPSSPVVTWSIPVEIEHARKIKDGLKAAIVVHPVARTTKNIGTIARPIEQNIIVGPIYCAFITDYDNRVIFSVTTT
jgi:hypothetical protein